MIKATLAATAFVLASASAFAAPVSGDVTDVYKNVIVKVPHTVEVCEEKSGDVIGGGLLGALIGGAITNNIGSGDAAPGAILGGIIGANEASKNKGKTVCKTETRYTERMEERYSHSTITFYVDGQRYTLRFQK